jgi:hypothetical protein
MVEEFQQTETINLLTVLATAINLRIYQGQLDLEPLLMTRAIGGKLIKFEDGKIQPLHPKKEDFETVIIK